VFELGAAVACPRPCLCPASSKEAYSHGKKDLSSSKETYSYGKKDLSTFKKRPIAPECPVMVVCIHACRYVYTYIRVCARACMHVCPVHGFARYVYKCACECEVCQYKRTHRHTDTDTQTTDTLEGLPANRMENIGEFSKNSQKSASHYVYYMKTRCTDF